MIPSMTKWTALGVVAGAFAVGAALGFGAHFLHLRATPGVPIASVPLPVPVPVVEPVVSAKAPPQVAPPRTAKVTGPPKPVAPPKVVEAQGPDVVEEAAKGATPAAVSPLAGVPTPTPTAGHIYRVEAGDTLSEIAERAYGSTKRLPELLAANPGLEPTRMRRGTLVYVPLEKAAPSGPAAAAPAAPAAVPAASVPPPARPPSPK